MVIAVPERSKAALNCLRKAAGAGGLPEAEARVFQDRDGLGAAVGADGDGELYDRAVDAFDVGFGGEFAVVPAAGQGGGGCERSGPAGCAGATGPGGALPTPSASARPSRTAFLMCRPWR